MLTKFFFFSPEILSLKTSSNTQWQQKEALFSISVAMHEQHTLD